mgnify:FL=1
MNIEIRWEESKVKFDVNKLPSSMKEIEWYWRKCIQERNDLSKINISENLIDFGQPDDYFDLSQDIADNIALIGKQYDFFSQEVFLKDFELHIWGNISGHTQIGTLMNSIKFLHPLAETYGLFAKYKYIGKSVYCAITVCFVDKDFDEEMEIAVFEISEDNEAYSFPIAISEKCLEYYTLDSLAKLSYWLGDFWIGIQYKLNNYPDEIRIVEQRGPITYVQENEYCQNKGLVLIKRVIPVDSKGNEIKYSKTESGRCFKSPSWGVRGHNRTLPDGRVIQVRPYRKGKDRENPYALINKEYQFDGEKKNVNMD